MRLVAGILIGVLLGVGIGVAGSELVRSTSDNGKAERVASIEISSLLDEDVQEVEDLADDSYLLKVRERDGNETCRLVYRLRESGGRVGSDYSDQCPGEDS